MIKGVTYGIYKRYRYSGQGCEYHVKQPYKYTVPGPLTTKDVCKAKANKAIDYITVVPLNKDLPWCSSINPKGKCKFYKAKQETAPAEEEQ